MQKNSLLIVALIAAIFIFGIYTIRTNNTAQNQANMPQVVLPDEVLAIVVEQGYEVEGSQPTTLRWIADSEEFVSVNLAAQSYGLGFMKKGEYDNLESAILERTTVESANDAISPLAGQRGFRASGRACIVGFTYTDSVSSESASATTTDDEGREVYSIIVCSNG